MDHRKSNATWLELAVAPVWRRDKFVVKVHSLLEHGENCFVLSVDERWLCSGEGKLTVFRSRDAVDRFLQLLGVAARQEGEPADEGTVGNGEHHCLQLRENKLGYCVLSDPASRDGLATGKVRRHRIQSAPARACFISDSV